MALLLKKKHIVNSQGKEEELTIYTTKTETVDTGKPCKVIQVEVDGEMITGYIGCTDELDAPKASSKRVMVDGVEYAERKYMGIKDMSYYMRNTYPDTYQTLTEITEDMLPRDTSDATNFKLGFNGCSKVTSFPFIDTSNGTNFQAMYLNCSSATEFPFIDTSKGTAFGDMYTYCSKATSFPLINTSNGTTFNDMYNSCSKATSFPKIDTSKASTVRYMYANCGSATTFPQIDTGEVSNFTFMYAYNSKATYVSEIDFSKATDDQLSGISTENMFLGCSSLRSITFNNLPIGTTEETLRSKCWIPDTVTEIIMNYRSE